MGIDRPPAAAGMVVHRKVATVGRAASDRHLKEVALVAAAIGLPRAAPVAAGSAHHREAAVPAAAVSVHHREAAVPAAKGTRNTSRRAPPRPINAGSATDACLKAGAACGSAGSAVQ